MESRYLNVKSVLESRILMVSRVLAILSANAFRKTQPAAAPQLRERGTLSPSGFLLDAGPNGVGPLVALSGR